MQVETKLHGHAFGDLGVLDHRKIDVGEPGADDGVAAQISEGIALLDEIGGVLDVSDRRGGSVGGRRETGLHRSNHVGADAVILAVGSNGLIRPAMDAARPGGRVLLFAQTQRGEVVVDPAAICVDEKALVGSYSASVDLQEESVRFVMDREMDLERLISHRFPLQESARALELAAHPQPASMKVVIQPGSTWKREAWEGSPQ